MATHAPSMGARTRAPSVNNPSLSHFDSPGPLLRAIDQACRRYDLAESTFGRLAINDPRLIPDIRSGRSPRPATYGKVAALIASLAGEGAYQHQRRIPSSLPRKYRLFDPTSEEISRRATMRAGSAALLTAILSAKEAWS